MSEAAPFVVFSDDWGRHPSSCQHIVTHLLPRRRVTWINTIGTRRPRLDRATAARGWEKVQSWLLPSGADLNGTSFRVINPVLWPSFRSRLGRLLNARALVRALRRSVRDVLEPVVITTLPLLADVVDRAPAARWIYYCVDDYSNWPGLDGRTLQAMEAELVRKADGVIAVSETLRDRLSALGKAAHLLTHGVDIDFWRKPAPLSRTLDLPRPLVVFWGVIDRRMDTALVRGLSRSLTEGTILLVGPRDAPDAELLRLPRVVALPPLPFAELPALAAQADVLIAPYADLPVTRAMQPLKLKEYLATGKPVVVRKLPATESWADCADVTATPEAFAAAVMERLRTGLPETQRQARQRLEAESWAAKAAQFERWVDGFFE